MSLWAESLAESTSGLQDSIEKAEVLGQSGCNLIKDKDSIPQPWYTFQGGH